jgi:hypothetical protein
LLENYLESIQDLPSEVRRNFALMRELDIQSQRTKSKREREKKIFLPFFVSKLVVVCCCSGLLDTVHQSQQEYLVKTRVKEKCRRLT